MAAMDRLPRRDRLVSHLRDRGRVPDVPAHMAPQGRGAASLVLVILGYPQLAGDHERTLWTKTHDESSSARVANYDAAAGEDALYLQPRLLESELAGLLPRRPGRPNLYLVGVAGYAEQDVFLREVNSVDALFAERFGTRGRSVRLVNNRSTIATTPLATRTSIAASLKRVGSLMDPRGGRAVPVPDLARHQGRPPVDRVLSLPVRGPHRPRAAQDARRRRHPQPGDRRVVLLLGDLRRRACATTTRWS